MRPRRSRLVGGVGRPSVDRRPDRLAADPLPVALRQDNREPQVAERILRRAARPKRLSCLELAVDVRSHCSDECSGRTGDCCEFVEMDSRVT